MTIIDGKIGFTGGYNIAEEYFNITSPYGHWKDTGVRLTGAIVRAMTVTYLEMWNAVRADDKDDEQFASYLTAESLQEAEEGFVQFYADNPMDKKPVGEDVYLSLISRAEDYLFIVNAYFIFLSSDVILSVLRIPKVRELTKSEWLKLRKLMIRNTILILLPGIIYLLLS